MILRRIADAAFDPDAGPRDLLLVVASLALFWSATFRLLHVLLHPLARTHPRLREAMGREYDRVGSSMCRALGVGWTRERYIEITLNDWPKMQGIYLQHFAGGALCLPAVLGTGSASGASQWASGLACLGVLSEMGWELSDVADVLATRAAPDGRERMPDAMVAILAVHHSMTLTLGLPLVLRYRELRELHLMTFNLQWAAAIAIGMNEYTKCLDLSRPRDLTAFRVLNGTGFAIMAWMRGVRWLVLSGRMMRIWYDDEEFGFLFVGSIIIVLITGFNFILCIYPFWKKMMKYGPASKNVLEEITT